ncbi:hypothetical protein RclHR1_15650005 [Rhizophagus clarus]|uniref:F-box domain-containing protein n=1 Tax=Rhizophagus clarus TaxID=94130 RepID=A0A2Z6QFN0_9GLOM|nr:hypothetical protein RclHR1_15650005 [Rhizophagus clarus]GES99347.1 hypothetical protein GLOIN_2v1784405 [Rhizophagus clarus]
MTCQLPSDCLNEIFEYLEEDRSTLYSCLSVNHLWCEISVRILWRNICKFKTENNIVASSILSTLISCLPNESKKLLYENKVFILTPTSKLPLFNYVAFCKVLSINFINEIVCNVLKDELLSRKRLVTEEIIKMFANQIYSLKKLFYHNDYYYLNFSFPYFPGLRDLSELRCASNLPSNFFNQLSQICRNLHTLSIDFESNYTSNELKELISLQSNLKILTLSAYDDASWKDIIPALKNNSNAITKLYLYGDKSDLPLSFVGLLSNLQEFIFSFMDGHHFEDFKALQHVKFSNLQTLKFSYQCPRPEYIMKFLENNGKNLKKFFIGDCNRELSLSIANFCSNLKSLFVIFKNSELDMLKTIFINCKYLESIKVWCGKSYFVNEYFLSEEEVFEAVVKYSPNNFCELKIYNTSHSYISSEDLESFFISWKNRIPKKILSLVIIKDEVNIGLNLVDCEENVEIIEKYENLGVIKFRTIDYEEDKDEEELIFQ